MILKWLSSLLHRAEARRIDDRLRRYASRQT